jgi:hypothetical protein
MSVLDERLVHLRAAGLLRAVRGVVFGQLSIDRSEEDEFEDFLLDLVSDLNVPILTDFPAGHEVPNLTIPLGTEVELTAEETTGWITYREDALVAEGVAADARRDASERRETTEARRDTSDVRRSPADAGRGATAVGEQHVAANRESVSAAPLTSDV